MISNIEKNILIFIKKNISFIALGIVLIFSIILRRSLYEFSNSDMELCLIPWYEALKENGGVAGLGSYIEGCNYNLPYRTIIALMTYTSIDIIHAYKLVSGLFDYVLAAGVAWLVYDMSNTRKWDRAVIAFIIVVMSPLVFLNSSMWGQCDSIYTSFCLLAIVFLEKEKYVPSFVLVGCALGFKLQAIFILPIFVFYYIYKNRFSILYFFIIPVTMEILSLPAIIAGAGKLDVFRIYMGQTDWFPRMTMHYPTFWYVINNEYSVNSYEYLKTAAILTTVVILGCAMFLWISKSVNMTSYNLILMMFVSAYTCVEFLPSMHERYGYIAEVLALVIIFFNWKFAIIAIPMWCIALSAYGNFLFDQLVDFGTLSWMNAFVYFAAMIFAMHEICLSNKGVINAK